jgi:hypothetical protein
MIMVLGALACFTRRRSQVGVLSRSPVRENSGKNRIIRYHEGCEYPLGTEQVFISYSWDSNEHKTWVLSLANRLRGDSIDAILDQTHLDLGGRTPEFMERSVRDSRSVLVICTEKYKSRFDNRQGGAGYEEVFRSVYTSSRAPDSNAGGRTPRGINFARCPLPDR